MASNTIDNDRTMSESEGTLLANRYRIVRQLGQGGMGSVWLAEDTLLDNKQFAIKMLPSILVSNKRAYNQLKSEALVAMKLSHPNIVTLRAFEENNGNPFLVMDYIDGQTLDDYLADGLGGLSPPPPPRRLEDKPPYQAQSGLTEDEVVRILKPIAVALDYAHSQGVVHRDIKPANIMIRKDGMPFVLDFGISREMQETMTRVTGKLSSGTLLYMSPEQLHGAPPKKEQDIYSFAAMAYECMSGHPPFCRGQIEFQIDNDMPEPLVGRDDPIAPQSIASSVMSGLAKKPEDRPGTCADVLLCGKSTRDGEGARVESASQCGSGVWCHLRAAYSLAKATLLRKASHLMHVGKTRTATRFGNGKGSNGVNVGFCSGRARRFFVAASVVVVLLGIAFAFRLCRIWVGGPRCGDIKTLTLPGGASMKMIYVAPGSFMMGSPASEDEHESNETQHRVTLTKGFWLGKFEVTQAQWRSVMGTDPSSWKGDNLPVDNVSWDDCMEFVRKVNAQLNCGARLPTEAEWEYACRAGATGAYGGSGRLDDMGWYDGNIGSETHEVGGKKSNDWGFYDMHGNVWEWCSDWYGSYSGNTTDPTGLASGDERVARGGSLYNSAWQCRSAFRGGGDPDARGDGIGFRLCCSAGPRE